MKNKIHLFNQVHNPFFFLEMNALNALKKTKETINNKYNLSKMIKQMRSILLFSS